MIDEIRDREKIRESPDVADNVHHLMTSLKEKLGHVIQNDVSMK